MNSLKSKGSSREMKKQKKVAHLGNLFFALQLFWFWYLHF